MKKRIIKFSLSIIVLISIYSQATAQTIAQADKKRLRATEDTLKLYSLELNTDSTTQDRMIADSFFTRTLVRALKTKNSFYYPFDSLLGISKIYAPDTSFRIFTWRISFDDYYSRQKGAIQLRTTDGSLKLIPLRDCSEFTDKPEDSVRTKNNWIGAVYYNIIKTQFKGKNYYTLFGIDNNNAQSNIKWIEVMTFNEKNEPVFGGPYFSYAKDSIPKAPQYRYSIEFKKDTRVMVNYVNDLQLILVDHLISETDEPDHKWTYIPDGDNEGFKWENGKWLHVDKVFNYKVDMNGADPYLGRPPMGDQLMDNKGTKDEKKLQEKTDKNRTKENDKEPVHNDN